MALTDEDLKAIRLLMREEIEPFRDEVNERFREVDRRFEDLYARNEKREEEYLFIKEQRGRQEQQLTEINQELRRHMTIANVATFHSSLQESCA
jgi:hypothetical protein